jgi:hypothetical protein
MEVRDIKRFMELWACLKEFRAKMVADSEAAVKEYVVEVEPEPCRVLLEPDTDGLAPDKLHPQVRAYRDWVNYRLDLR